MKLSRTEVEKIADLARLTITPEEAERFAGQLSDIFSLMESLNELDTADIAPTAHTQGESTPLRDDTAVKNVVRDRILAQAPDTEDTLFKVPQVIQS